MFAAEPSLAAVLVDSLDAELEPGLPLQEAALDVLVVLSAAPHP